MEINFDEIIKNVLEKKAPYFFIGCSMVIKENENSDEAIILNINGCFGKYETDEFENIEKYKMDKYEQLKFLLIIKRLISSPLIDDRINQLMKIFNHKEFEEITNTYGNI